jgi:diguanylate cyclase (GGDEF)-like protein/PAS domain S-box-containing protein
MPIRLTTLARLAGLGDDPQTTEEERYRLTIARFGALVFVGDAALIFAAAAIGGRTPIAGVVIPTSATAMTVCFLVGYRRLSLLVCQLLSVTGTAMIGTVVYLTYPSYGLLFVPAVCVIAFLFPLWLAIAQTCWMVVCFGVAVWVAHPAGFDPLEPSLLLAGTLAGILLIVVTLKRRETRIVEREREGQAILDAFFASSPLGVAILDPDLRYVRVNQTYADWSGTTPAEHTGRGVDDVQPGIREQIESPLRRMLATGDALVGLETTTRGRHYRASHYPIRGAGGRITLIAAIIDDVTEIKETEVRLAHLLADEQAARLELEGIRRQLTARNEQLAAQAATDPLTKLANRAAFDEQLTIALVRADRDGAAVGVVYIDLDGFKEINDRYGHAAGDQLLEAVAGRLTSHQHANDVIARIGGDEFLLLLTDLEPRAGRETLAAIATRIQGAIAAPISLPRHGMVGISSSVGTSLYPDDAPTAAELVAAADRAMYRRKRAA